MIDRIEAKTTSLEVWGYLKDHPEIKVKGDLPIGIYNKIKNSLGECALCQVVTCSICPLNNCVTGDGDFLGWSSAKTKTRRKKYAKIIYNKIKEWKI